MTQREADSLPEGEYRAVIDATLEDGSLTYGEVRLDGSSPSTVLLTTTVCHPALANDNLSGIVVLAALARALAGRLVASHATASSGARAPSGRSAGSTTTAASLSDIVHGLAISCVGDRGHITYKRSRRGDDGNRPRSRGRPPRYARRRDRRLVAVRRRRAPVLLARLRPTVRSVLALAGGRVPRVPLLRRRPVRRHARGARRLVPHAAVDHRRLRARQDLRQRVALRRAAARPPGPLPFDRGRLEPGGGVSLASEPRRRQHEPCRRRAPLRAAVRGDRECRGPAASSTACSSIRRTTAGSPATTGRGR